MADEKAVWTLGRWHAKPGCADTFQQTWQAFATWTARNQPGASQAYLLRDDAEPDLFFSFGPWDDADDVAKWRSTPEFGAFAARVRELCDSFEPHSLTKVGEVA